ncbi:hypothetical protein K0U07_05315, partial [bacterium]|nr:hypothetical protein [bacterium]
PNFGNWCYANVVTQLIVYIPDLERLLLHAEPKDRYGKKLQKDLLALVQVMKRNGTCSQVHAASKKYRNTFLTNLKKFRTKELNSRSKKPNDVVDYMHYLGERLGIFEFNDGQVAASFSLIVEGNFPTSLEQKARVLILSFSESKKGGYSPPDSITVNGQIYELKGYINRPKSYGHFTSMTKVSDGSWIKQDDLSVSRKVSKERRDLSGVYVMCYVLP